MPQGHSDAGLCRPLPAVDGGECSAAQLILTVRPARRDDYTPADAYAAAQRSGRGADWPVATARAGQEARLLGLVQPRVPGAAGCATPMPSPTLLSRTRGRSDVCRSPTGARRRPVLSAPPSRTHLVVSHCPDALRDLAGARSRVG